MSIKTTTAAQIPQQCQQLFTEPNSEVSNLIADNLTETTNLLDVMDYMSFRAAKCGLTQEKLDELLTD